MAKLSVKDENLKWDPTAEEDQENNEHHFHDLAKQDCLEHHYSFTLSLKTFSTFSLDDFTSADYRLLNSGDNKQKPILPIFPLATEKVFRKQFYVST